MSRKYWFLRGKLQVREKRAKHTLTGRALHACQAVVTQERIFFSKMSVEMF